MSCCHSHTSQLYLSQPQHSEKVAVDEVIRGEKQEVSDLCLTIYVTCGDARRKMSKDFEVRRQDWNYTHQGHNFNGSLNIKKIIILLTHNKIRHENQQTSKKNPLRTDKKSHTV